MISGALERPEDSMCDATPSYLEGAGFEQGDLVVLGQKTESWDMFGELHHLLHCGREGQREVLPDLLGRL